MMAMKILTVGGMTLLIVHLVNSFLWRRCIEVSSRWAQRTSVIAALDVIPGLRQLAHFANQSAFYVFYILIFDCMIHFRLLLIYNNDMAFLNPH